MSWEVEAWAREQKTGDPARKGVLMALANYADPFGRNCYPSIPRVAEEVEISVRTVQRHLATLEQMGLVKREPRLRDDGSLSTNLFVFPTYIAPKLSHREPPRRAAEGGAKLTPGGDSLAPAGDAGDTGLVTMVSPQGTTRLDSPPTADERSSAVPPQGGLPLGNDGEEQEEKQEEEEPQAPRARRGTRLPEDWTPPPIDTLPLTTQAVLKQWPSGAYEFVATGFAAHWTAESGARASKKDWQAAWVKWLSGESARVMAAARTGIRFAAPDTTNPVINAKLAALQDGEDGRSQRIREQLRRDVGDRTYDGWLKQTAITVSGGPVYWSVKVTAASDFAANWLKQHFAATIRALACKLLETDQVTVGIVAVAA